MRSGRFANVMHFHAMLDGYDMKEEKQMETKYPGAWLSPRYVV